ncbi:MAG: aldo/keto reductase [Verrucomicrobia bacterium]|nr:aldo/keto reductase [Verrucomicrobiota bacterium]
MEYRPLGKTGIKVSTVAFGASPLGDVFGATDEAEGVRAVHLAIDQGINYFDVAPLYGLTLAETRLGKALKGKRDQIFLATKCCRDNFQFSDFSASRVQASIDESLARLQTDHVDVLQIHDVEFGDARQIMEETLPAARKVQQAGKARFIGISGLPVRYLRKFAEQIEIDTILTWGHYNLLEDEMDEELTPLCRERGIGLINASPLHQRLLTDKGAPEWHRSPKPAIEAARNLAELCRCWGVNLADVAMKYCLEHPHVATTIVGMSKVRHVEANLKALDFEIPEGLMPAIENLVKPVKNMMWFEGRPENNIPPSDPNRWVPQTPVTTHT